MLKSVLAVLAAVFTNALVVSLAEWLNSHALPPPTADTPAAFAGALAGILVASFLSGLVAGRLAPHSRWVGGIVGVLLLVVNAANAFSFWHPVWFRVVAVALPLPLALWGSRAGSAQASAAPLRSI